MSAPFADWTPPDHPGTFEIGLVLAGATSAGCYTAGVVDYLIEALEKFEHSKANPGGPQHNVRIRVIAGASAGGITAAGLLASLAGAKLVPPVKTILYDSWVQRIDFKELLRTTDLTGKGIPRSLLHGKTVAEILDDAFEVQPRPLPPYVAEPLDVVITLTNLRGVPYRFQTVPSDVTSNFELMSMHSDYVRFAMRSNGNTSVAPDAVVLNPAKIGKADSKWAYLRQISLATAASPLALAPQRVFTRRQDYILREWPMPSSNAPPCTSFVKLNPEPTVSNDYEIVATDGGAMNNEPLELGRLALAGRGRRNARNPATARRAIILIDPIPGFETEYDPNDDLLGVARSLIFAWWWQARFNPEELALAYDEDVYSRFIISPSRSDGAKPAIFSSALSSFAGFLSSRFREHDYELGRRNCQYFLREHFLLSKDNRLFANWDADTAYIRRAKYKGTTIELLPIIPLPLDEPSIKLPDRPQVATAVKFDLVENLVKRRMDALAASASSKLPLLQWIAAKVGWALYKGKITNVIMSKIRNELDNL
jgi:Patatin-like phospholipase